MHFLNGGNIHIRNLEKIVTSLGFEIELTKLGKTESLSKPIFYNRINVSQKQIELFCKKYGILYLALFGSILREDFGKQSDIDVMIKLDRNLSFFELAEIEEKLQNLFKTEHPIDLLTEKSISPLIKDSIMNNLEVIYDKAT